MKKLLAIFFTVFLNFAFYSCTPTALQDDTKAPQACCGNEGPILPPPPTHGNGG